MCIRDRVQQVVEERHAGMELAHFPVSTAARQLEALIRAIKLPVFVGCGRVRAVSYTHLTWLLSRSFGSPAARMTSLVHHPMQGAAFP